MIAIFTVKDLKKSIRKVTGVNVYDALFVHQQNVYHNAEVIIYIEKLSACMYRIYVLKNKYGQNATEYAVKSDDEIQTIIAKLSANQITI